MDEMAVFLNLLTRDDDFRKADKQFPCDVFEKNMS